VEQTGYLEFREVELNNGQPVTLGDYLEQTDLHFIDTNELEERIFISTNELGEYETVGFLKHEDDAYYFEDPAGNVVTADNLSAYAASVSWIKARGDSGTPLTGDLLADAYLGTGQQSQLQVAIEWDDAGAVIFDQIALRLHDPAGEAGAYSLEHVLGIFLDNTLLSAPKVNSAKFEGKGVISGSFTLAEAEELANLLKSGALPMPLEEPPLFEEKVSATLGAQFIEMSWLAGLIGIILVMVFMMAYYRLPGLVSAVALVFYGVIMLALFKLIPVTLSLAGIGGFIVSIGMAVDANVLIFERLKEELRSGRTLGAAIETGFKRAWSAIWDSNVTTVIVCIILYWLGSSIVASAPVMGFALTLGIGVVVSMFTAIVVTRTLLRILIHSGMVRHLALFNVDRGKL
jgi:preprotein translocase subunit SecD